MGELLNPKAQRNAKMRTRALTSKSFLPQEDVTIHLADTRDEESRVSHKPRQYLHSV